jgi:two-component system sensor histidine kinase KdpD
MILRHQLAQRERRRDPRPDPEKLLARLKAQEERAQRSRGQLRIYLGAAPGVGKTYAMLNEGRRRQDRRTADVVIGALQTYGRPLTCQAAEGLEVVPPRHAKGDHEKIEDVDVDAILTRRPTLVLVDELEHRNAPGGKHEMRWQDVEEILDAGIAVISTLDIAHLASLSRQAQEITGIPVRDTVPDWVMDQADDVELIDMTPEALRARLRHGNVFPAEQAQRELEGRFQPGTLGALRRLALRRTAREVDSQLQRYIRAHDLSGWRVDERVLVCIDHRAGAATLLRRGRLMARSFDCPLTVACIHTRGERARHREAVAEHRRLAEEIGAEIREIDADDPVEAIAQLVSELQVTQVLVGHAQPPRWLGPLRESLVQRLLRRLPDLDIHIIAEPDKQASP